MSVVPKNTVDKIAFYENHNTPWTTNAVAIGTTTTAVSALATLTSAARTAFNTQQAAQQAAKAATLALKGAVDAMGVAGSDIIKSVKTKAATTGNSVYTLAQIPAPALPSPMGPLGTPTDFKAALSATGALELSWKCTNPVGATGTTYQVWRRVGATGGFAYIGGVGMKKFTDDTLPAGSSAVTYQIQAVRSTSVGAFAQFNVNFGVSGGGVVTAFVTESLTPPEARIAA